MKYKYLLLVFIMCLLLSVNAVVASENNVTNDSNNLLINYDADINEVSEDNLNHIEIEVDDSQNSQSESNDSFLEVYVGTNENDGDGSPENPFSTLMLARNKIAETNSKNAIINIYDGTYQVPRNYVSQNKPFTFDTDNLIINGLGKNVILIPDKNDNDRSFVLTTTSANFTMNNIIFNAAAGTTKSITGDNKFFKPVSGNVNAKITNCTFLGNQYTQLPRCIDFNTSYIGCIFKDFTSDYLIYGGISESSNFIYFEDCIFSNLNVTRISSSVDKNKINVTFNGIWIGQNTLPTYAVNSNNQYANGVWDIFTYGPTNDMDYTYSLPVKYAIFSVSENYLSGNQYEIVGRLTWNGTDNSEGMENFPPISVTLTSATGEIQNAILVNGTFKAIYNSDSSEHKVSVKLDSEEKNLTFSNIALNLNAPTLNYGGNQNIGVNLSKPVTGIVTVTVNGKNYPITIDNSNSITVPIDEVLTVGTHNVNVTFLDEENHIYGFNTTTITISTVKEYAFDIGAISNVKVGDTKQLVITLPNDATGNVTVYLGTSNFTATVNGNTTTLNITGFVMGQNTITVIYSGNDKYEPNTKNITVSAVQETKITAPYVSTTYNVAKNLVITLKDDNNQILANKKVTVKVGSITKTLTTNAKGQVSLAISSLVPNTYTASISFAGDDNYVQSTATAKVIVTKAKPKLTAKKATFKAKTKTKKYSIVLKDNKGKAIKKAKVTLKVKGKTYKATTNSKGKATFKITKLTKKGKNTATIKFGGNNYFKSISKKVKIVVKK